MSAELDKVIETAKSYQKQTSDVIEKLYSVAQPEAVYGKPISAEGYTVIPANEVMVAMGHGYGFGSGSGPRPSETNDGEEAAEAPSEPGSEDESYTGVGSGGGGGGYATGRPVAVIRIAPDGVVVEPVVDLTKIGLAFFTAFGSMLLMLARMRSRS